jgi:aryl-alcohol dehydrogenase-like predicted oxidoreductase
MKLIERVWLGTVQIGLPYGLAQNQPDDAAAARLLDAAWDAGIRRIDTARLYGAAEARIGAWLGKSGKKPVIATKIAALDAVAEDELVAAVDDSMARSRLALGIDDIDYVMVHHGPDLLREPVRARLENLAEAGAIGGFGLSCYAPEEAIAGLDAAPAARITQLPGSIADWRCARSDLPERIAAAGGVLVLRSLYLQGALLIPPDKLPAHLAALAPLCKALADMAADLSMTPALLAVRAALASAPEADAVLGFDDAVQLAELAALAEGTPLASEALDTLAEIAEGLPEAVIDPRQWPVR